MLKKFDREDLDKLWSLVKETFSTADPTKDKEKELWVDLKRLYEPDPKDQLWAHQRYMHDPLEWKLYDTCGVHHVFTGRGHEIFMLVEKDYPLSKGLSTLIISNKLQVDQYSEMANELLVKIYNRSWKTPTSEPVEIDFASFYQILRLDIPVDSFPNEDKLRGRPGYDHQNEQLHILIETDLPPSVVDTGDNRRASQTSGRVQRLYQTTATSRASPAKLKFQRRESRPKW
ncbi:uncharacterized mitochondrial protein-like protein [Tanacetum coccineum]